VRLGTSDDGHVKPGNGLEIPSFLPQSRTVLVIGGSNVAVVHDPVSGQALGPILDGAVRGPVAASPDGRLLVAERATGGGIGIWDLRSGRLLSLLPGAATADEWGPPIWSPDADIVALDFGGVTDLWHVADPRHPSGPERIAARLGLVGEVAFTPDDRRLVAESTNADIGLFDVATGRTEWTWTVGEAASGDIALSPDGATLGFSYSVGGTVHLQLFDTATGTPRAPAALSTTGGFGYVYGGRWLIVAENLAAPQAQLYDASTLEPIGTPFPTRAAQFGNALSGSIEVNEPGTMFAQMATGDPLLWHVDPDSWLKLACTIAGRNLTGAEWQRYLPNREYERTCPQYPGA
jgi:WD40 repeat protein